MRVSGNLLLALSACIASSITSAQKLDLGEAITFGALAPAGITNTGATVINGDLGTTGTSITGFPPGVYTGTEHINDGPATNAQANSSSAFTAGQGLPFTIDMAGTATLGGALLVPGIYKYDTGVGLSGTLTLDGGGDSEGIFIFQLASTLITATSSDVVLQNGAQACNVFWIVGSSATLGTYSHLVGNVLAAALIALGTGAVVDGGLYAGSMVTLDTNTVTLYTC